MQRQLNSLSAPASHEGGVVLLEVLIAVLIFSLGILGLVGIQASMIKNTTSSQYRSEANYIAQQLIGRMWADPCNLAAYAQVDTDISARLPGGKLTVAHDYTGNIPVGCPAPQFIDQTRVEISWQIPGDVDLSNNPITHRVINTVSITGG